MKILFSSKCLEYRHPGHPESPERISRVYESLRNEFEFVKAKPCKEEDILRVHSFQSEIVFNLQIPCFSVLEGGYSKEMPVLIKNFLKP